VVLLQPIPRNLTHGAIGGVLHLAYPKSSTDLLATTAAMTVFFPVAGFTVSDPY
jgi:hypothetical protein